MGPDKILLAATIAAGISGTGTALGIPHAPAVAERSPTDSIPSFPMGGFASVCSQLTIDARTGWYYLFAKCCASDGKSEWSNFALDWALATNDDGMLVGMQNGYFSYNCVPRSCSLTGASIFKCQCKASSGQIVDTQIDLNTILYTDGTKICGYGCCAANSGPPNQPGR